MKFYNKVRARLGDRICGFDYVFQYLRTIDNPVIVETGCSRQEDNYEGDGMSSLLFDAYINEYGGSFYTVDISEEFINFCKSKVSNKTSITHSDSVLYLKKLNEQFQIENKKIDLLYLDSFCAPRNNPLVLRESQEHHFFEFITILPSLKKGALVGVDDNWMEHGLPAGKSLVLSKYMNKINNPPVLNAYQIFWKWQG
jgi:hypothetical protein